MTGYSQAGRLLSIASPLPPDTLLLRRLLVEERLGRPFSISAEVLSVRDDVTPETLINRAVTCTVNAPDQLSRHFHGIVRSFIREGSLPRGLTVYRLIATPRLWQLGLTADCRIFQNLSVRQIVQSLVEEGQAAPLRFGTLPQVPRPYVVQWNETDLDFVQRLLAEIGASYFFRHGASDHVLHVSGANADFPLIRPEAATVRHDLTGADTIADWRSSLQRESGAATTWDHDGLRPQTPMKAMSKTVLKTSPGGWEVFRWPGGQSVRPDADPAKLAVEGRESGAEEVTARGADPAVFAGGRLKIAPGLGQAPATWLVTAVRHEASDETHVAGGGAPAYRSHLTLMPAERTWRDPAPWPRPVVPGLQSALVTGPAGEEVHCDRLGRIKVHFLWDRQGPPRETSSCWCRVAQPWAGAFGGAFFLPRVGDEVLVGFMEGDADRPVVVGSLYNDRTPLPYPLPANRTRSWIVSRSSKGGTQQNANILRLEDRQGAEEFFLQAEKDMNLLVKNGRSLTVQKADDTTLLEKGSRAATIALGDESVTVARGKMTLQATAGSITLNAGQSITLRVGLNSLTIDQTGLRINGMLVTIDARAAILNHAPSITNKADALLVLKGGALVMG
jgi:type VI secretion system secreted protein VgrG